MYDGHGHVTFVESLVKIRQLAVKSLLKCALLYHNGDVTFVESLVKIRQLAVKSLLKCALLYHKPISHFTPRGMP